LAEPIPILLEDERLVVVSKPAGLLSVATPGARGRTVEALLREQGIDARPVHRLDREVSGALLCARDEPTRECLDQALRERRIEKTYWALARGIVRPAEGAWTFPILDEGAHVRVSALGKRSRTRYRTLRGFRRASEVEIELVTGRHNQIRVHFAHAGFPLVGERKFARGREDPWRFRRVALHAWRLAFTHPWSGTALRVEAPLPADLAELVQRVARDPGENRP
jgi:23S rRNA pseudouridine1911/1915/1917 synthase